ncbi:MAG: DUF4403 family protein [Polyangiaceae bacterium]
MTVRLRTGPLALLLLAACGGAEHAPETSPSLAACRVNLSPRSTEPMVPLAAPAFAAARSTLIVNVEVPLGGVKDTLEAKVGRRVAEERDHDIGMAGRVQYTVDRGPFAVSVQGDALVIEAPLHAHAQACAKGGCYAGCDPEAKISARVPLQLGANYKFRPSAVKIEITRGCEMRALGGLVRIDMTPMLQARLTQESKGIEAAIDRDLPDLRPQAERVWAELAHPRALPLGACVVLAPGGIIQGPASGAGELARLRFGLLAHPELRARCGDAPRPVPLPPLHADPSLPVEGDVHLALLLPPDAPATAFEGTSIDVGKGSARLVRASGSVSALTFDLSGDVCGPVGVGATGAAWSEDGRAVHLTGVSPLGIDGARLASAGLDAALLSKGIEHAPIAVAFAAADLKSALPALAKSMSDERATVSATVSSAAPETAGLRADRGQTEVTAVVRVRGALTIHATKLPDAPLTSP